MALNLEKLPVAGYEQVIKVSDPSAHLLAIIAIHDTTLGPALGGTRILPYENFDDALEDVLRLARGMTYKSAIAQTGLGGGKSVIIADPKQKTPELLCAFGQAVDALKGTYIAAEDVNCSTDDVMLIAKKTPYVTGITGPGGSGDPSPFTAWGTFLGVKSVLNQMYGSPSAKGRTIAIQGVGNVGAKLAQFLFWEGAKLVIQDTNKDKEKVVARQCRADIVTAEEIFQTRCDVFAPCALGGVLNAKTIESLGCLAVAGGANNQLLHEDEDGDRLAKRNILYAPDYVINAGGVINVGNELDSQGYNAAIVRDNIRKIDDHLESIYSIAKKNRCSTAKAANELAEYRVRYRIGKRTQKPVFPLARSEKQPSLKPSFCPT